MNRTLWMGLAIVILVVIAGFILLSHTRSTAQVAATQPASAVSFTLLAAGSRSTVTDQVNYRVANAADFAKLWAMTDATTSPPAIDFSQNYVIGVFAGEEPTAGYAIAVSDVQDAATREVSITLTTPSIGCAVSEATTAPYEIVEVPARTLPLSHQYATSTACAN